MNKIERHLIENGWFGTRIDKITCGSWPEKHVRITMWNARRPVIFSKHTGEATGHEYAEADAATVAEAFVNLKRNIEKGYCKFFPGTYENPVEKDYKKWKASKSKVTKKASKKTVRK